MKKIFFLANPSSPHVRHWESLLNARDLEPHVIGITKHYCGERLVADSHAAGPLWLRFFPSFFEYALLGLILRIKLIFGKLDFKFIHAHNASGYGFAALISGLPYCVTTYGSEIYSADSRGRIYKLLIKMILGRSNSITSSSLQMTNELMNKFNTPLNKIHQLYLGVSPAFHFSESNRKSYRNQLSIGEREPVWFANRRIHPHYSTLELCRAFILFSKKYNSGRLLLLEGDSDDDYLRLIKNEISSCPRIHLISGFINQSELAAWLSASDFSISIPRSDQLSSSILESMYCECIPILGDLLAYDILKGVGERVDLCSDNLEKTLFGVLVKTFLYNYDDRQCGAAGAKRLVDSKFSFNAASKKIFEMYSISF